MREVFGNPAWVIRLTAQSLGSLRSTKVCWHQSTEAWFYAVFYILFIIKSLAFLVISGSSVRVAVAAYSFRVLFVLFISSKVNYSRFIYLFTFWFKNRRDSGRPYCWLCLCIVQSHCIFQCLFSLSISLWLMVPSSLYLKSDILVEIIVWTYRAGYKGRNGIKRFFFFSIFLL